MSKIEQIISELEDYVENCKLQPLSNSRILVNKTELEGFIDELKANIPEEIKKYQRIIANRDAILKDAQDKAEEMIKKANEMTIQLVSDHEIMQQAYKEAAIVLEDANKQATEIMDNAKYGSSQLKSAASQYLDDGLAEVQNILMTTMNEAKTQYGNLVRALDASLSVVNRDRNSYQETQVQAQRQVEELDNRAAAARQQAGYEPQYGQQPEYGADGELSENTSVEAALGLAGYEDEL